MATKPEIERLAVLETKVDILQGTAKRIEEKLDNLDSKYLLKEDGKRLEDRIKRLKWQTVPLSILMTSVITALVYYFISHVVAK